MVSTAFLFNVIIYGLIAAVILPAIDLIFFVIREGRRPGYHPSDGRPSWRADGRVSSRAEGRLSSRAEGRVSSRAEGRLLSGADAAARVQPQPRVVLSKGVPDIVPGYVASNGITVTPSLAGFRRGPANAAMAGDPYAAPSSHPHAEYWSYGNVRFYEGR